MWACGVLCRGLDLGQAGARRRGQHAAVHATPFGCVGYGAGAQTWARLARVAAGSARPCGASRNARSGVRMPAA